MQGLTENHILWRGLPVKRSLLLLSLLLVLLVLLLEPKGLRYQAAPGMTQISNFAFFDFQIGYKSGQHIFLDYIQYTTSLGLHLLCGTCTISTTVDVAFDFQSYWKKNVVIRTRKRAYCQTKRPECCHCQKETYTGKHKFETLHMHRWGIMINNTVE